MKHTTKQNASQAHIPRAGRPPKSEPHDVQVFETRRIMAAIKAGARDTETGKALTHETIGAALKLSGNHKGKMFSRYLRGSAALTADRLEILVGEARERGWLAAPRHALSGCVRLPEPLAHLKAPADKLMREHLAALRLETTQLTAARDKAVLALTELVAAMQQAKSAKLVHEVEDIIDGETTRCMLNGVGVDLTATAQAIAAALVIHEDHLGAGGFFP